MESLLAIVRALSSADKPALVLLLEEMQAHYEVPCPPRDEILADLQLLPREIDIFVACDDEHWSTLLGFASFSAIYPGPGLESGLFLKEIFVTERARGQGIGKKLIQTVAALALARGHTRVDWTADRTNARLMTYYKGFGAQAQEEKIFYRLRGDALRAMAGDTSKP